MRINELLSENEQLDELNLARGINRAASAVGKVTGRVQGKWQGAKDAYQQAAGSARTAARAAVGAATSQPASSGGTQPTATSTPRPAGASGLPPLGVTPTQGATTSPPGQGRVEPTLDPAGQQPTEPASMKASDIVGGLKGVWDKAKANQDSQTASPAVQAQIRDMAKGAGMTGQRIESVAKSGKLAEHPSKFLGRTI